MILLEVIDSNMSLLFRGGQKSHSMKLGLNSLKEQELQAHIFFPKKYLRKTHSPNARNTKYKRAP